jgi:hypothetical protein
VSIIQSPSLALLFEIVICVVSGLALTFLWNGLSQGNWSIGWGDAAQWIFIGLLSGAVGIIVWALKEG